MDFSVSSIMRMEWRAHEDLTSRAKGGTVIYFTAWLLLSYWGNLLTTAPLFFTINTGIFIAIAAMRILHYRLLNSDPKFNTQWMYHWLVANVLISALHWGIITAIIVYGFEHPSLHYPLIIILSAFAMGGTAVLSISRVVGVLYPFLVYGPFFVAGFFKGTEESLMLNVLALISLLYIFTASRVSHNDYWSVFVTKKLLKTTQNKCSALVLQTN